MKTWDEIKQGGSGHYKADGGVECIDLYRSMGILRHFAIASIIKYAARNTGSEDPVSTKDMNKIIHYAEMLKTACGGEDGLDSTD